MSLRCSSEHPKLDHLWILKAPRALALSRCLLKQSAQWPNDSYNSIDDLVWNAQFVKCRDKILSHAVEMSCVQTIRYEPSMCVFDGTTCVVAYPTLPSLKA